MNYSEMLEKLLPEWAKSEEHLKLFGVAIGLSADIVAEQRIVAATAGLIAATTGPDDALPLVATERGGLSKYPLETYDQWRERLMNAAASWEYAGSERCIAEQFAFAGYPGVTIVHHDDRVGPHGEEATYISHYWLLVPASVCPTLIEPEWDHVTWGYFWWDTGALPEDFVELCLGIIAQFGDPTSFCRGVEIG